MPMTRDATALVATVKRLESELTIERSRRLKAEQALAGQKSAVSRLQALLARRKADDAERRAQGA
jgi:hypothetical protein